MRRYALRFAILGVLCLDLAWAWGPRSSGWNAQEVDASLFGDEAVVKTGSNVERTATTLDVEATIEKWFQSARTGEGKEVSKGAVDRLVVLTTVAFQAPAPPVSVGGPGTGTQPGCSVGATTQTGVNTCSTNAIVSVPPTLNSGSCSTGATTTTNCSAYSDGAGTSPAGSDNTTCSAFPGGNATCSAGGASAKTTICSTGGGQSGQGSDGAVGCSAAGAAVAQNCSAYAGTTTCSTSNGQHQSCSAGAAGNGTSANCSTYSGGGTCSVSSDSTGACQMPRMLRGSL